MESKAFITEAIRYYNTTSDQVFEMMSLYQSNSEAMFKQTITHVPWLPDLSKESYLTWNDNYQQMTVYLKSLIDTSFEQAERDLSLPLEENSKDIAPKQEVKAIATPSKTQTVKPRKRKASPTKAKATTPSPKTPPIEQIAQKASTTNPSPAKKETSAAATSPATKKGNAALPLEKTSGSSQTKPNPVKKQATPAMPAAQTAK